ncbi:MAG: tetratricopeptide repeat protein [Flavobacteriaceae bacterium]|nr:tetratricopeptide repeat protein [Flavobacteriaceae bacterium]
MRLLLYLVLFGVFTFSYSQEELANDYFSKGEFEKALSLFQKLEKDNKRNINYKLKIIEIYRQLEELDKAESYLANLVNYSNNPVFSIELGYNYALKNDLPKAEENYNLADQKIIENPSYAYNIAKAYEKHSLLEKAIFIYNKAMEINPDLNFNIQLARIYGEQGDIAKMFNSYLNFIQENNSYLEHTKRSISGFISEDDQNENNIALKRILLKKIQKEPNLLWNEILSWLFIQQKDYKKSFVQEKAIFNRKPESLQRIVDLALISMDQNTDVAKEILEYIILKSQVRETEITAHNYLLKLEIQEVTDNRYAKIQSKFSRLFEVYGLNQQTIELQLSYAQFLAFILDQPEAAITFLKESLEQPLSDFQVAAIKLKLGDILVFQEKFNEALIYFTQIQRSLKNSTISQEARLKVAKTSYYKGDFDWAETQLKILKSSTSQLIANDALDLKLLISDNKFEDSTQTALKLYSRADLLAFQNKTNDAIEILDVLLNNHKGETIEDQALFFQAELFLKNKQYINAESNYKYIMANWREDILIDDAIYMLAELYRNHLDQEEKAKELYEQIVFNHADSIYFIEARKKFRALRGDVLN